MFFSLPVPTGWNWACYWRWSLPLFWMLADNELRIWYWNANWCSLELSPLANALNTENLYLKEHVEVLEDVGQLTYYVMRTLTGHLLCALYSYVWNLHLDYWDNYFVMINCVVDLSAEALYYMPQNPADGFLRVTSPKSEETKYFFANTHDIIEK